MTTIVYDGDVIAIDSQITIGDNIVSYGDKHTHIAHDEFTNIFFSGDLNIITDIVAYVLSGFKKEEKPEGYYCCLLLDKHNRVSELTSHSRLPTPVKAPYTSGSGATIALTALSMGATAEEAVKKAIELDVFPGGEIYVHRRS